MKILDLAKIMARNKIKVIGKNLVKNFRRIDFYNESSNTIDLGRYFAILPEFNYNNIYNYYKKKFKIDKFPQNKSYNSDQNEDYLNETGIKKILRKLDYYS